MQERQRAVAGPASSARRPRGARARARRPRAARRRRRSSPVLRLGITPWACWMIPTSSTSVCRWSVRTFARLQLDERARRARVHAAPRPRASTSAVASADGRPGEVGADPARLGAGRRERARDRPTKSQTASASAAGSANGHEAAGAGGEHVLGVPVRRRDDGAAGGDRERQRAGGDLLAVAVRRHEDVGHGEQVGELVDRRGSGRRTRRGPRGRGRPPGAPAAGGTPRPRGARPAGGCARRSGRAPPGGARSMRGQRVEHGLDALAGREEAEGREQEPRLQPLVAARHRRDVARPAAGGELVAAARRARPARRAGRRGSWSPGRRRARSAGAAPSRSSRSRARPGRRAR